MLTKVDGATTVPVSVEEAKRRLLIDTSDRDQDIALLVEAATEATETHTGLTLRPTVYELKLESWCTCGCGSCADGIKLAAAPVQDVLEISYFDQDDIEQTLPSDQYYWIRTDEGATVYFVSDWSYPSISTRHQSISVLFRAGFENPGESGTGDDPELKVPGQAIMAILFLVGHWFTRSSAVTEKEPFNLPFGFEAMANQIRIFR